MFLRPPPNTAEFTLFLSSSDQRETKALRQRIKSLVDDVFSPQLRDNEAKARLAVRMWERAAAEQARPGETTNQRFVRMARESSLTLVLILDELRDGTREELEAAADEPDTQVAVLSFRPKGDVDDRKLQELDALFEDLQNRQIFYQRHKRPDSQDAWFGIIKILTAFLVSAMRHSDEADAGLPTELR